ncbi:uncharacterized protein LOC110241281 [Exaiptasia diaphana]|uniref:SUEL-type lectin domain-containing protein n=1 Tax=Exaiptasia diaphana TaxID=2652724 RepID=A0A913XDK0_EXADI|nr:uncharacterized protein LOC110241281 [Exaiptasia diaphana]KXJ26377.1 hypothetical protein AC249_AIPGENE11524 [Exaiptasia diaphana]
MTTKKQERFIYSWLILILCLQKYVEAKPAGIPIPPGVGKLKSAVACENQKAFIVCPNIFNGIDVVSAMFGRQNSLECLPPGDSPASFCTDQEDQVKQQVKDLCQGEDKCEISASNDFLAMEGTQVCPQVSKYLEVKYRCVPKDKIPNDDDEYPNVAMETLGGQDVKSSIATEVISSSSPASEVQVLLGNSPPKGDDGGVIELANQPNSSENSQEVTEPLKGAGTTDSNSDPNEVHETIAKSIILESVKDEQQEKDGGNSDNKQNDSVLDDAENQSRNDDKYWR